MQKGTIRRLDEMGGDDCGSPRACVAVIAFGIPVEGRRLLPNKCVVSVRRVWRALRSGWRSKQSQGNRKEEGRTKEMQDIKRSYEELGASNALIQLTSG